MKVTEQQIRRFVRRSLIETKKRSLRKVIKEEMMTEASDKTFVKTLKINGNEMLNANKAFTVVGFKEQDVDVKYWDKLNVYRVNVSNSIDGNVSDETLMRVSNIIMPKFYSEGVVKNQAKFDILKTKGKQLNIGNINQRLTLILPSGLKVVYK